MGSLVALLMQVIERAEASLRSSGFRKLGEELSQVTCSLPSISTRAFTHSCPSISKPLNRESLQYVMSGPEPSQDFKYVPAVPDDEEARSLQMSRVRSLTSQTTSPNISFGIDSPPPALKRLAQTPGRCQNPYSSMGFHSSWLQIQAWGSSTEKNTSVGSLGPS